MIQIEKSSWKFFDQNEKDKEELLPFYEELDSAGIISVLKNFSTDLIDLRNGFDHAWTQKSGAEGDFDPMFFHSNEA